MVSNSKRKSLKQIQIQIHLFSLGLTVMRSQLIAFEQTAKYNQPNTDSQVQTAKHIQPNTDSQTHTAKHTQPSTDNQTHVSASLHTGIADTHSIFLRTIIQCKRIAEMKRHMNREAASTNTTSAPDVLSGIEK